MRDPNRTRTADREVSICLVGDQGVGKTHLLNSYLNHNAKISDCEPTMLENHETIIKYKNENVRVKLWDSSGAVDFWNIRKEGYNSAFQSEHFYAILCYSCIDEVSVRNAETLWVPELLKNNFLAKQILLLGTKADLVETESRLVVPASRGYEACKNHKLLGHERVNVNNFASIELAFKTLYADMHNIEEPRAKISIYRSIRKTLGRKGKKKLKKSMRFSADKVISVEVNEEEKEMMNHQNLHCLLTFDTKRANEDI